jgi:hypothetical protein
MTSLTVPAVDTFAGKHLTDVTLTVRRTVRLTCGCDRVEADRPGGGMVGVIVGAHCATGGAS